jgi:uncharacterized protein YjbI with pentapeptide repeats
MKIIKPQTLGLLTRPVEFRRDYWLGCAVVAFLPVGEAHTLLPEVALWPFLAEELPPDQPLDAVIPKVQAEFLAIAHAFAPDGVAAPVVSTTIQLGASIKELDVFGDRHYDRSRGRITEPVPFTRMKIDWTRAYGGDGFADNPLGKGTVPVDGSDGRIFPVENVVDRARRGEGVRSPAAYGPVDQMWPVRAKLSGTYDDAWLKQDFPGFARDIDWHFFNMAPADQWLAEPLLGHEAYAFKNLHPTAPLLKGCLPGLAPRLFVTRKGQDDSFEEVPLTLTTLWFFPHRERLVMVHHGRARLAEEDGADIARVTVGADRIGALRPAADFHAVMIKRADSRDGALHALRDQDLVAMELLSSPPAQPDAEPSPLQKVLARQTRRAEQESAAAREQARAAGLDPDKFAPAPPPAVRAPTLEELPIVIAAAEAAAEQEKQKAEAELAAKKAALGVQLAAAGMAEAEIEERLNAKPKGPPAFSVAAMRASVQAQINAMHVLGMAMPDAEARLTSPEVAAQWQAVETAFRNTYRLTAQHQDPADALSEERSAAIRRMVSGDTAAVRALYDLHGADLSGLDLSGLDLSGVCLDGANLTRTSFAGAKLVNAVLAHTNMQGCSLNDADLSGANLGKAHLAGATFQRAVLKDAVLAGADFTNASLAGADLAGADLTDMITTGSDWSNVRAPSILAMKLTLHGLRAPGIQLGKAKFVECDLEGSDLTGASLEQAVFLDCNLAGIRLAGARMCKAVFVKACRLTNADLSGADLTEANLRGSALPGANLHSAVIERADLSGADMSHAVLTHARGTASQLIGVDLRQADLSFANFSKADLARADLRGSDLTRVSVYEANLARTRLDDQTRRGGMFRTRMRYLPVYQPPPDTGS